MIVSAATTARCSRSPTLWAATGGRAPKPYDGLAIRTGQPERRLMLPDERELYVTARYVRDGRCGPVRQLVVSLRGAG